MPESVTMLDMTRVEAAGPQLLALAEGNLHLLRTLEKVTAAWGVPSLRAKICATIAETERVIGLARGVKSERPD